MIKNKTPGTAITAALIVLILGGVAGAANIIRHDQTASGLQGWRIQNENIKIELNPLQKNQVRAFYLGRGFSEPLTERIADSCVYQTVIENTSGPNINTQLEVYLSDWRINSGSGEAPLPSKDEWIEVWTESGASAASILAFKWATFPTQQFFKLTGDFGWGMILFGKQIDKTFDLRLKWITDGELFEQLVKGLSCPD